MTVVPAHQLAVPGRHARVSDFLVDAAAACVGIAIAWTLRRLSERNAFATAAARPSIRRDWSGSQANQRRANDF